MNIQNLIGLSSMRPQPIGSHDIQRNVDSSKVRSSTNLVPSQPSQHQQVDSSLFILRFLLL